MPFAAHHRQVLESLPVGYAETTLDGVITDVNPELCRLVGQERDDLLGRRGIDLGVVEDGESVTQDMRALLQGDRPYVRRRRRYRQPGGRTVHVLATTAVLRDDAGGPTGFVTFLLDESDLKRSDERFRQGFLASPTGMALVSPDRVIVDVNDRLCAIGGYSREEMVGSSLDDYLHPEDLAEASAQFAAARDGDGWTWQAERPYVAANGTDVIGRVSATRIESGDGGHLILVQLEDVTRSRRAEEELVARALRDTLTGLPNRALLDDRLSQALRHGGPVAVMLCGLDRFTLVNDALGHSAGDAVLRQTAERLVAAVGPTCTVGRLRSDEFVIVAESTDADGAAEIAAAVEAAMREPLDVGEELVLTASVGITIAQPEHPRSVDGLLHDAAMALRLAKRRGKDRHTVFDEALRGEADLRALAERALRTAIPEGRLTVHYQPVLNLSSGDVVGFEALCRLTDEDGTAIPPSLFIDVAEELGRIESIGAFVLDRAVAQCAAWHELGHSDLHVAVNVSAHQTTVPGFAEATLTALEQHGVDPKHLVVELTESVLIEATPETVAATALLRDRGVGIAIDDFGTRYASLRYVQQFPVTTLKIDKSFTDGLPESRAAKAIVQAVAQLAHSLELDCVAEGIETAEQCAFLTDLQVCGQGYLLARPMDAEAATTWLTQRAQQPQQRQ